MSLDSVTIATQGLLQDDLLIATQGLLDAEPTPPTPVIVVDGNDGGIAWRGRFGTRLPRPKELSPDVAEKRVVKKVAKRLGISKAKAQIAVTQAQRELASLLKFNRVQSIAYSNYSEEYTPADIAMIKTWWATLEREAIERAEEEELLLLI